MKHTLKVTLVLVVFFFMSNFVGLLIINHYIDHKKTTETSVVSWEPLPYNLERPEVKNQSVSFIYIALAILIGTILVLLLIRFNKPMIWRIWFLFTVWLTLAIAFAAFINAIIAAALALVLAILKLYKPNVVVQNFTELFIYGGLAAIFVPIINLFAAFMLLILISVYDFIAVYKTKHMVKLAKFQSKSKVFAGILIPYKKEKISVVGDMPRKAEPKSKKYRMAILGGGDIGFTLIFAGVVMKELMLYQTPLAGFLKVLIIPIVTSLSLLVLLLKAKHDKFYPAMPVLSLGCFIGYLLLLLF